MKDLDLIIDALESAYADIPGWVDKVNEALYAARRLRALKNHKDVMKTLDARSEE